MTQHQKILEYIRKNGSITPMEAIQEIGCTKLATRVGELKRAGYNITGEMETGTNRWGEKCHYMRYKEEVA